MDRTSAFMLDDIAAFLPRHRPLGVLILPPISEQGDLTVMCDPLKVPYVRAGLTILASDYRCVGSNDLESLAAARRMLIDEGHRQIGFVREPMGLRSAEEREAGFGVALATAGLPFERNLCFFGNYRFASVIASSRHLLEQAAPPSATFENNDKMAASVMHVALGMGNGDPGRTFGYWV